MSVRLLAALIAVVAVGVAAGAIVAREDEREEGPPRGERERSAAPERSPRGGKRSPADGNAAGGGRRAEAPAPPQYGFIGHASHQNGLDVDVYYPRADRRERAPRGARQIDRRLSQELVDRFVAAGAVKVFVGPATGLRGPPGRVVPLVNHDNHLHARIAR